MNRRKPSLVLLAVTLGALFPTTSSAFDAICQSPELVSWGGGTVEYSVYTGDPYDDDFFVSGHDLDLDGDTDLVLAGAFYPYRGEWDGEPSDDSVILINQGNKQFTKASGDAPKGVHPIEILYADFDANGLIDFFVADHGYDAVPFPGYSNSLMMQFEDGWVDASDRLPADEHGFTHNAALGDVDGDGDPDLFVFNNGSPPEGNMKYWLINDGAANFAVDTSFMPDSFPASGEVEAKWDSWLTDLADFDADGFLDLLVGGQTGPRANGGSRIYWGGADGFSDGRVTLLSLEGPMTALNADAVQVISNLSEDVNGDGHLDLVLGGYDGSFRSRFTQLWMNTGSREFLDQTNPRLGPLATQPSSAWHQEFSWFDFNGDGYFDIVPYLKGRGEAEVIAWLGDGAGYFHALSGEVVGYELMTRLGNTYIRSPEEVYSLEFKPYLRRLTADAGVVSDGTEIKRFPCPLSVLPPLTPIQRVGLEEELLP